MWEVDVAYSGLSVRLCRLLVCNVWVLILKHRVGEFILLIRAYSLRLNHP